MHAVNELATFETILAEATRRGFSFEVARGVYTRQTGEPCPFMEPSNAGTISNTDSRPLPVLQQESMGPTTRRQLQLGMSQLREPPTISSEVWLDSTGQETETPMARQVAPDQTEMPRSSPPSVPQLRGEGDQNTPELSDVRRIHATCEDTARMGNTRSEKEQAVSRPDQQRTGVSTGQSTHHQLPHEPTKSAPNAKIFYVDYETRSRCDLKACGSAAYAEHPSTEVLCLAYRRVGAEEVLLWTPMDGECPLALRTHIANGDLLEAVNCTFEQDIWHYVCHLRLGWPAVPPEQWRDTAAICAAFAIPQSLEKAGAALGLAQVKDAGGHAVMMKLSKPRKPSKANPSEWHTDPALFEQLYAYCRQDVVAESALHDVLPPLSPQELEVWKASNAVNRRGIACDRDAVRAALRMMTMAEAEYHARVAQVTGGVLQGDDLASWQKVLPWCAGRGVHLPNYQKGTLSDLLSNGFALPEDVREILTIRLALGRASTAKLQAMLDRCSADGRIRNTLNYHGAAPGRWAGRGIQPQNMPRGKLKPEAVDDCLADMARMDLADFRFLWGDPFAAASNCIRGCLAAPEGRTLIAADYSAIEARVANWLAGQLDVLDIFRAYDAGIGPDIYRVRAAAFYRKPIAEIAAEERQLGKAQELGCQFGLGWFTFISTALEQYGLTVTEDEAKAAVNAYRESHPMVVGMWRLLEEAAIGAVRSGQVCIARGIKFKMQGEHLKCRLPSGRLNTYPFARVEPRKTPWGAMKDAVTFMGEDTETHQWTRLGSYGGFWMENCTQGVARDLMAEALLRAEARGFPVVLTVHDELVAEIDDTPLAASPEDFSALMCELPAWAAGLPVAAAGWRGRRYRKG